LPEIVIGPANQVPACMIPKQFMEHVGERNRALGPPQTVDRRFSDLASVYESIGNCVETVGGKCVAARWDYAFFQALVETNYLRFSGRVKADGFNFGSIGAMTPGNRGEWFSSVHDGVLAHLQHVLMYAGVPIQNPVYPRTSLIADDVRETFSELGRPITFADLASIWTGTHQSSYGASIRQAARGYRKKYCKD
jgi:hypothetical protein